MTSVHPAATPCATPTAGRSDESNDPDCVNLCGNGQLDQGELCDPAIAAGAAGACPTACQDLDPCTTDKLEGTAANCTARCLFVPIADCRGGDGCCPQGCNFGADSDCPGGSLGDACDEHGDCLQGLCLGERDGAPGGYCSQYCEQDADCGAANSCVGFSPPHRGDLPAGLQGKQRMPRSRLRVPGSRRRRRTRVLDLGRHGRRL